MADGVPVPIGIRSHEQRQLSNMVPDLVDRLEAVATEDNGLAEDAETLARVYEDDITTIEASDEPGIVGYVSMPADVWRMLVRHLPRLHEQEGVTRIWWLRGKLVSRLKEQMREMDLEDDE